MNAQSSSAPVASTPAIPDSDSIAPTEASPTKEKRGGFAAFQSRNFVLLWTGLITSNVGTWMAATAEGWLVTDLKGDSAAFSLGLIAASFAVPLLLLPPVGGAVADRVPRLKLLWTAQLLYLVLATRTYYLDDHRRDQRRIADGLCLPDWYCPRLRCPLPARPFARHRYPRSAHVRSFDELSRVHRRPDGRSGSGGSADPTYRRLGCLRH